MLYNGSALHILHAISSIKGFKCLTATTNVEPVAAMAVRIQGSEIEKGFG